MKKHVPFWGKCAVMDGAITVKDALNGGYTTKEKVAGNEKVARKSCRILIKVARKSCHIF
ncbi:MAG: hypothetical protein IKS92_09710 [Victivallales bacterium]|nr:hypothetical protein [Victivallales bacterium]